jgi:hypothetical protein
LGYRSSGRARRCAVGRQRWSVSSAVVAEIIPQWNEITQEIGRLQFKAQEIKFETHVLDISACAPCLTAFFLARKTLTSTSAQGPLVARQARAPWQRQQTKQQKGATARTESVRATSRRAAATKA